MADRMHEEALEAVQALEDADDDELYRQLGLRVAAIERDPSVAGRFAPSRTEIEPMGIALGDLVAAGRKAFANFSRAGYNLLCGGGLEGSRFDAFVATLGTNRMAITAGFATLLVAQIGFAPAIAGVVATLVIGKVAPTSVDAICIAWQAKAGYAPPPTSTPTPTAIPAPSGTPAGTSAPTGTSTPTDGPTM